MISESEYPMLSKYTAPVKPAERAILGRDKEINQIKAALMRPELCNVMLLAPPGSGKTACVQGTMKIDRGRRYLEVDLAKMIADLNDSNEMAARLKSLFDETADYRKKTAQEVVLFIDEFHQIVQLSPAAVEAMKPLLADSGTRGIRVIAATTFEEFRKYISPNQPLVERLQRINLPEPDHDTTIMILKSMAERYGLGHLKYDNNLFELIYEYTNRYMPSNAQPRKSILVLDAMIGWSRSAGRPMDLKLLADVIYESEGVNVSFRVDPQSIKSKLDKVVLSQEFATRMIEQRLQICVADLNDKSKPMSSFLFSGSTGTGKALIDSAKIPVWTEDGRVRIKNNGDLQEGDFVFDEHGNPTEVKAVFPQGDLEVWKVYLQDGRVVLCCDAHMWTVADVSDSQAGCHWEVLTTEQILQRGLYWADACGKIHPRFQLPSAGPVNFPHADLKIDPYVMGAYLYAGFGVPKADGNFGIRVISGMRDYILDYIKTAYNCVGYRQVRNRWVFLKSDDPDDRLLFSDVFDMSDSRLMNLIQAGEIPDEYKYADLDQRLSFMTGVFDVYGATPVSQYFARTNCEALSEGLKEIMFSLGVDFECRPQRRYVTRRREWTTDYLFFAERLRGGMNPYRPYIQSVIRTNADAPMTCIYVQTPTHLYLANDYVVTHNTAVCKALAKILFESDRNLIRMDMTEYANPSSLERFRQELTTKVWERPYSIVLLDEIEKACAEVTRLLLQVLDDGRLSDQNNRIVQFVNCYIVMTTNAGSEIYRTIAQYDVDDSGSGKHMKKYMKIIRDSITSTTGANRFPPELLGRIDVIVPFQPLSESTMKEIVTLNIKKLKAEIKKKHGVEVKFHSDVIRYLVEDTMDTDSNAGGARAVIGKLESEVTVPLAEYVNLHPDHKALYVYLVGELVRDNVKKLTSDAYIEVGTSFPTKIQARMAMPSGKKV